MKLIVNLTLLLALSGALHAAQPADHLFIGQHIVTMEPDSRDSEQPTAVAVKGEQIVWTGSMADSAAWTGPGTVVHELGEQALLPGFIDAHGHLTFLAATISWANLASPPVGRVTDLESLNSQLSAYIDANGIPAGAWVLANGYDDSLIAEQRHPDRTLLDSVSTDHPIALMHVSGHLMALNSLALAKVGIDAESIDPPGGRIRRVAGGREPNGVLEETATYPVRGALQQPTGNPVEDLKKALGVYAGYGITTVQDGAIGPPQIQALQSAAANGLLNLDVVIYPIVSSADLSPLAKLNFGSYQNRLKIGGIKLTLDGSPQGKTAYLTTPYLIPPAGQSEDYRGYPIYQSEKVDAMVAAFLDQQIPILAHANGDAAADQLIHAVAAAASTSDHRTVMIHAQTVREDQLDQMASLKMIPSYFSTHTFYWGDWHRDSVLGPTRAPRISPTRSTVERDMPFTVHNDAPIVPPDMLRLLWASTNRITRSGAVLGEDQRLTTYEALEAITRHAAFQYFEEDRKGTLATGKLADLVILSANPLSIPTADLESLEVRETWSHGRVVYQR
jgi:predicted amidohydrolase YtcJ